MPRDHLFIAGTGRAGTSFLVRYLAQMGLETHVARYGTAGWHERANAGFEDLPIPGAAHLLPYVVKSPWLTECIDDVLADPAIRMRAVIIPMRDLAEAATSRVVTERHAIHANAPFMAWMRRPWTTQGGAPGGVLYSLDAVDQARLLAVGFHVLVQRLVRADVPIIFLDFPRLVQDGAYLFDRLRPVLPDATTEAAALAAHAAIARPEQVRAGEELAPSPTAPDDAMVENAALRRELMALRAELSSTRSAMESTVAVIRASTSWRITAPLRALARLLSRG